MELVERSILVRGPTLKSTRCRVEHPDTMAPSSSPTLLHLDFKPLIQPIGGDDSHLPLLCLNHHTFHLLLEVQHSEFPAFYLLSTQRLPKLVASPSQDSLCQAGEEVTCKCAHATQLDYDRKMQKGSYWSSNNSNYIWCLHQCPPEPLMEKKSQRDDWNSSFLDQHLSTFSCRAAPVAA